MSSYPTSGANGSHPTPQSPPTTKISGKPESSLDPLSAALASAQARYTVANPNSLEAHTWACQDFPGGNTRTVLHSSPFPITFGELVVFQWENKHLLTLKSQRGRV
jgi:glutamate-1-semialdehyde 2,1-aminomutase